MIVLAGSGRGLVRGARADDTWNVDQVIEGADVRALAADADTLYAGTDVSGVWCSDDRGRTWRQAGLEDQRIRSLAVAHGRVYAGTKPARVWVSPSGGRRWEPLARFPRWRSWFWWSPAEKPHTAYVQALCVSPTDPQVVLAGIEAGALVRSADGGTTWSGHRRRASRDPHVVGFHPADGAWAYEGGGTGAAVSRDGGVSWQKVSAGLDRRYCWAVAADPAQPGRWYVAATGGPRQAHGRGHAGAAVFRAEGEGWRIVADDLPAMPYLLTCPAPNRVVAVLEDGEVHVTRDAGDSWETLPITLGRIRTPSCSPLTTLSRSRGNRYPPCTRWHAQQGARNVWIIGGGDLTGQFADAALPDEVIVMIAPVTLGAGAPLLPRRIELRLEKLGRNGDFASARYAVGR